MLVLLFNCVYVTINTKNANAELVMAYDNITPFVVGGRIPHHLLRVVVPPPY